MNDLTFTYDLEDNRPDSAMPRRFDLITLELLETLAQLQVRGTFFVVGTAAQTAPELIRQIADAGHEVALHSYDHQMLPDQSPTQFSDETARGKALLEQLTGKAVVGYRAPNFSLTRDSTWAAQVLTDLGFVYSSSVLPVAHPYYGFPGVPRIPFLWPSGLLELPAPVARFGPKELPYLGGTYFRLLPAWLLKKKLESSAPASGKWFYAHPHDFDYQEPFYKIRDVSWFVTVMLRLRRRGNLERMRSFLADQTINLTSPFCELVAAQAFSEAAVYSVPE